MLIFVLHAQAWAFPGLDSDHSTQHKSIVLIGAWVTKQITKSVTLTYIITIKCF